MMDNQGGARGGAGRIGLRQRCPPCTKRRTSAILLVSSLFHGGNDGEIASQTDLRTTAYP